MNEEIISDFVDNLSFDALVAWADFLHLFHDEQYWGDDEWPDKEIELKDAVDNKIRAIMDKYGLHGIMLKLA